MNRGDEVIKLEGINFSYPGSPYRDNTPLINGLDLTLRKGDRMGLTAPNGSGKTTLFHIIMGLIKPDSGRIEIFGQKVERENEFQEVRQRIGLLFQDADDQLFSPTVIEDVAFGPLNLGKTREEAVEISRKTLNFLGLDGFEDRVTFKLSGGEKRLVSLAAVLAMGPEVLLLDEPTLGLDMDTKLKLAEVLADIEPTCIVISHEFDFITSVTDHFYTMEDGRVSMDEELHVHQHQHAHKSGKGPHKHI